MIAFDEIDGRLKAMGLDRNWLAEKSGRNRDSIRVALAPNAPQAKRSELLQRALSQTIENEESRRRSSVSLPERISLEPTPEEFEAWDRASRVAQASSLQSWAIAALNRAAEEWHARQATTYRNLKPLPPSTVNDEPQAKTKDRK